MSKREGHAPRRVNPVELAAGIGSRRESMECSGLRIENIDETPAPAGFVFREHDEHGAIHPID
jgi:hypothetical protein